MKKIFKIILILLITICFKEVYAASNLLDDTNMYNRAYKNMHLAISDIKNANLNDAESINYMINYINNGTYYEITNKYQRYYQLLGLGDGVCASYNDAAKILSQMNGSNCFNIISHSADHMITSCYYDSDWRYYDATGKFQPNNQAYNARASVLYAAGFTSTYEAGNPGIYGTWFFGENQSTNLTTDGLIDIMDPMPVGASVDEHHNFNFYDDTYSYYVSNITLADYDIVYRENRSTGAKTEIARIRNVDNGSGLVKDYNYLYFINYNDNNKPYRMNLDGSNKTKISDTEAISIWREFDKLYIYDTDKNNVVIGTISSYPTTSTYTINDGTSAYKIIYVYNNYGATIIGVDGLINDTPTGVIQIPSTLSGQPVIGIAPQAFRSFDKNTVTNKLVLPSTLLYIGEGAFRYTNIKEVVFNNGLKSIGSLAFDGSKISTKVVIPNTVTFIGEDAFSNNQISDVELPNNLKVLFERVFANNNITSVSIPSSLEIYSGGVYGGPFLSNNIEELSFGNSLKHIDIMLSRYPNLKRIILNGNNLTYVNIKDLGEVEVYAHSNTTTATTLTNAGISWIDLDHIVYTIETDEDNITIDKSQGTKQLSYTIKPSYGNYTTTWTSNNPDVATVNKNGKVTLWMQGNATISLTLSTGEKKNFYFTVTDNPITEVSLGIPNSKPFRIGSRFQMNISITPSDADPTGITYTSSNPNVLRVNSYDGKFVDFEMLSGGEATLTITTPNGIVEDIQFRVYYKPKSIAISAPTNPVYVGDTFEITRTIVADGEYEDLFYYTSSNPEIVEVLSDGTMLAKAVGSSQIYLYNPLGQNPDRPSASANVQVKAVPVESIELNKNSTVLTVGDEETLTATISPTNAGDKTVTWSSSNTSVATVDSNGKITAIKAGTATITAKSNYKNSIKATCIVTVNNPEVVVTGISLNKSSTSIVEGNRETLTATISPSNATNKTITWSSSDTSVATVTQSGIVTAIKAGTATITAKSSNNLTATCKVTVTAKTVAVTGITLNKESTTIVEGNNETLIATITPTNATNKTITWTSSNTNVATVDSNGKVTAIKAGTAIITARTNNNKAYTCTVTVTANEVTVTSVSLNKTSTSLKVGNTESLVATITPTNATNKTVTWTSSNTSVATVDSNGKITAKTTGTTTITAKTNNNKTATCTVTVTANEVAVTSISLNKTTISLDVGNTETLVATITPTNATNKTVTWTSSNTSVATIDSNGKITALKAGTTTITATSNNGIKSTCVVTITEKTDSSLIPVYRLYNPKNGEHLYTTDAYEAEVIYRTQGWGREGIGWFTSNSGTPVYRLYNPRLNNHLYTSDKYEISVITANYGWVLDFNGEPVMYSGGDVPIYRLYNPGQNDQHHLTTDKNEYDVIPKWGWRQEGEAMRAIEIGKPETTYYYR